MKKQNNFLYIVCLITIQLELNADITTDNTNLFLNSMTNTPSIVYNGVVLPKMIASDYHTFQNTFKSTFDYFSQNTTNLIAQEFMRKLFDEILFIHVDNEFVQGPQIFERKNNIIKYLLEYKTINTESDKWLVVANLIGDYKKEVRPVVYLTSSTFKPSPTPFGDDPEKIVLGSYHVKLAEAIYGLTSSIINNVHNVIFDNDEDCVEFYNKMFNLAMFTKEDFEQMKINTAKNGKTLVNFEPKYLSNENTTNKPPIIVTNATGR